AWPAGAFGEVRRRILPRTEVRSRDWRDLPAGEKSLHRSRPSAALHFVGWKKYLGIRFRWLESACGARRRPLQQCRRDRRQFRSGQDPILLFARGEPILLRGLPERSV